MPSIFSRIKMAKDAIAPLYHSRNSQFHINSDRTKYEDAIRKLNSLQTNAATLQASEQQGRASHVQLSANVDATAKYLQRTGISLEKLDSLSVIHVTGTKGKGTSCALCESILREHGYRTGFYSSPHLIAAKERIRINGVPLSYTEFANHFDDVFSLMQKKKEHENDMPAYFKFMTVLAFNVFIKEQVDVAIVEVGIGGEYDCTNCIRNPAVVGITSLGLDHTKLLGNNLSDIAWQKGGIMKPGAVGFTVPQTSPAALQILQERAENRQCSLHVTPPLNSYLWDTSAPIIRDVDEVQALNISLALQMANEWMKLQSPYIEKKVAEKTMLDMEPSVQVAKPFRITKQMAEGLKKCSWPGRTQIIPRNNITYFLDGAHTGESIKYCVNWFRSSSAALSSSSNFAKILIFNATGQRDTVNFLEVLALQNFDFAIFTTNMAHSNMGATCDQINYNTTTEEQYKRCKDNMRIWEEVNSSDHMSATKQYQMTSTVGDALSWVDDFAAKGDTKCHVLITGSLHLVGSALSILDPNLAEPVYHLPTDLRPLQNIYNGLQAIL